VAITQDGLAVHQCVQVSCIEGSHAPSKFVNIQQWMEILVLSTSIIIIMPFLVYSEFRWRDTTSDVCPDTNAINPPIIAISKVQSIKMLSCTTFKTLTVVHANACQIPIFLS
jgi:hypothetical protein